MKIFLKISVIVLLFLGLIPILHSCKKEELPTLSTSSVTNITATSATGGGMVTSDGNASVTSRGICWSLNANPTLSDTKTIDGTGDGQYVSSLTGLTAGSTYYVRAYATNSVGTAYGADLSFATLGKAPECLTQAANSITSSGGTLNGTVNANYLSTAVTFEYSLTTSYGQTVTSTQSPVTGNSITNVSADISGLTPGTTYHYRVVAVNSIGTTNGNDLSFTTGAVLPILTTTLISNRTATTVTTGGNITSDGGSAITARGVCWSSSPNPTTDGSHTNNGTGTGLFTSSLTSLTPGATYYVRAYAANIAGTGYGNEISFTTNPYELATLTTIPPISITENIAISGGNITSDGGSPIIAGGVCWSTTPNPTIAGSHTNDGIGTGSFTSDMRCLYDATIYYVRAYATNISGTAYGNQLSFITKNDPITFNPTKTYGLVSDIDGNCYKTIQIGDEIWMAENLKTSRYNDGTQIPEITDNTVWSNLCYPVQNEFGEWINGGIGAFCWYNNSETFDNEYGKLYNWMAVNTGKLCPVGWRIPNSGELERLIIDWSEYNPLEFKFGYYLMETGTDHWDESLNVFPEGIIANNSTGFTALPGGYRQVDGLFRNLGSISYFWGSNYVLYDLVSRFYIPSSAPTHTSYYAAQAGSGYSVRCLKDN